MRGAYAVGGIRILTCQGVEAKAEHSIVDVGAVVEQAFHHADLEVVIRLADAVGIVQIFAIGFCQKFRHAISVGAYCEGNMSANQYKHKAIITYGW